MKLTHLIENPTTGSPDTFLTTVLQALNGSMPRITTYINTPVEQLNALWASVVDAVRADDKYVKSDLMDIRDLLVDTGHAKPNTIKTISPLANLADSVIRSKRE